MLPWCKRICKRGPETEADHDLVGARSVDLGYQRRDGEAGPSER